MHRFPSHMDIDIPVSFTNPFRYHPHPLVSIAADEVMKLADEADADFSEGKMMGVLIVSNSEGEYGYLAGFSGSINGKSNVNGFVPPIFDLLAADGHFKKEESEISMINIRIASLESSEELLSLKAELKAAEQKRDEDICSMKAAMALSKAKRDGIRCETEDASAMEALIRESQFQKAELRRIKAKWEEAIYNIKSKIETIQAEREDLRKRRAAMSDRLQKWIFNNYLIHNALGERSPLYDIFSEVGLVPPGGTGDCAAPKLLNYAYRNNLKPLAMGEFWYGRSPETAVRTHGHFYPSCTSKCGPLLGYMLKGLDIHEEILPTDIYSPEIIYSDSHVVVVEKPSGMPSVPGLDGRKSLQEWLSEKYQEDIFHVHRLDMDTSGVMVFARTTNGSAILQKQFEGHTIKKTYKARLSSKDTCDNRLLCPGDKGTITLPLSADYDERPRQKVDLSQGKEAHTDYEVISCHDNGMTDVMFFPKTGRTHQLRVHSAHILGLRRPIAGDMLYGGEAYPRLALHAYSITFRHPASNEEMTFQSDKLCY